MRPLTLGLVSRDAITLVSVSCDVESTINVSLHSLGQDDQNDVQNDFLGHVSPLGPALASCHADSVFNIPTTFLRSRQSK